MAIIGTDQDDPNSPGGSAAAGQTASQTGGTSAPQTGGGSGYVSGGSGQGATTSVKSAAPTSPGNYTNLQQYLQANQGSGATTGKAVENVVDQAGQGVERAIGDYNAAGNSAIAGASSQAQQQAAGIKGTGVDQNVLGAINSGNYSAPTLSTNLAAPTAAQIQAPSYQGVTAALQPLQGDLKNAAGGQSGVSTLLRDTYQQPSYTAGENGLDAFLAGGTQGGQAALSKAQSDWGGEAAKAANAQSSMGTALNNAYSGDQQMLTDATTAANNMNAATNKAYSDAIFGAKAAASAKLAQQNRGPLVKAMAQPAQPTTYQGSGVGQVARAASGAGQPIVSPTSNPNGGGFSGVLTSVGQNIGAGYQNSQAGAAVGNATDVLSGKKKLW